MRGFYASLVVVLVLWYVFEHVHTPRWLDLLIVFGLAVCFAWGSGQMAIFRRHWPMRALGIFWTWIAVAVLFALWGYSMVEHVRWPAIVVNFVRAASIVGGPLCAIGITHYIIKQRRVQATSRDVPDGLM